MVNFVLLLTVAFGLFISQEAIAAPTTAPEATGDTRFSFSDWADSRGIIANPETALSPEKAVQAFLDSMNSGSAPATGGSSLDTMACLTDWDVDISAQAIDVATIVHKFAVLGQVTCPALEKTTTASGLTHDYPEYPLSILVYDAFQTAMLMPQRAGNASEDPNNRGTCQNIAQTAAVVMDRCTQANGTVTGLTDDDVTGTKVGVFIAKNPGDFAWP